MPSNYPQHCGRNRHAVAMASRLRRGVVVVLMPILAVGAYGCSGPGRAGLSGVEIDAGQGTLTLVTGCYDRVGGDAELRDGQIVVTDLWGEGARDGDCAGSVPLDLQPGPDVVDPEREQRYALVGDSYRPVDYCGLETPRCVPFSTEPVPADCSDASLRFATIGMFAGVYPFDVVRCEGRYALLDIDTCGGVHGEDGAFCEGHPERVLLAARDGRWDTTGFEAELFCRDPADSFGAPDLPAWVCDP